MLVTFIYAYNEAIDRIPLWNYMLSLSSISMPWTLIGDFNCITSLNEVCGGRERWTPEMQTFKDCLFDSGMSSMHIVGGRLTWFNKRSQAPVHKHLDRMVTNASWFNTFSEGCVMGSPMAQFSAKLKHTKFLLKQLNRDHGNIQSNVMVARNSLTEFQEFACSSTDSGVLDVEKILIANLNNALMQEESFLLQKARVKWLHLGDSNNSFFHQKCKVNWNKNKVLTLVDGENHLVHGQNQCAQVAVNYFSQVLVKRMKRNKAPGPDGVNVEFFLATWHITGTSFCNAVKFFFESGAMHSGINSTFISLIPKTVAPTRMNDFRPISLCSVLYKCISKIIAMHLKSIMHYIVDIAQSAFIPGHSISDNVLLAQELFRGYNRVTGLPKCALKIDLHKAFDSLS
ncbi:uncharacterized protein LOC141673521 [Apium graveolens]|uniref:uncharacterized protein LOC141673521 n=1 Tax=Apium graveolens TaxID=4045 RepID=UPI003D7A81E4